MNERVAMDDIPQGLFEAMRQTETYIKELGLDFVSIELMRLRASQINGCAYCTEMHHMEAAAAGVSSQRLYSLCVWQDTPFYSDQERTLLEWTEKVTRLPDNEISSDLLSRMQGYFNQEEIANLTLVIAQVNAWNRLIKTFSLAPGHYKVGMHD